MVGVPAKAEICPARNEPVPAGQVDAGAGADLAFEALPHEASTRAEPSARSSVSRPPAAPSDDAKARRRARLDVEHAAPVGRNARSIGPNQDIARRHARRRHRRRPVEVVHVVPAAPRHPVGAAAAPEVVRAVVAEEDVVVRAADQRPRMLAAPPGAVRERGRACGGDGRPAGGEVYPARVGREVQREHVRGQARAARRRRPAASRPGRRRGRRRRRHRLRSRSSPAVADELVGTGAAVDHVVTGHRRASASRPPFPLRARRCPPPPARRSPVDDPARRSSPLPPIGHARA